jgi:putative flippase GtrA
MKLPGAKNIRAIIMTQESLLKQIKRFVHFASLGVIGTLAQYITLTTLVEFTGTNAVYASATGFIIGAFVNYYLNYHYTFHSNKQHRKAISKFFTVAFVGLILNTLIMSLLTQHLYLNYLLAQIIATGLVLMWNFLGNRMWTFS